MWLIIIFVAAFITIYLLSGDEEPSFWISVIITLIFFITILFKSYHSFDYEKTKELQEIEGKYIIVQNDDYILKWEDEIHSIPKYKLKTVYTDSSYFSVKYNKTIKDREKYKLWLFWRKNDTTIYEIEYLLYQKSNR